MLTGEQIRWLLTAAVAVAAIAFGILWLAKGKKKKAAAVLMCGSLCVCFLMVSHFRSVEEYGAGSLAPVRDGEPAVELSVLGYEGEMLLPASKVALREGETVMALLLRVAEAKQLRVEHAADYVEGIGDLYEFDYGGESGWVYTVNGEKASVSASEYLLKDGDTVCWTYVTSYTEGVS